jgi:hypothetical protein
VVAILWGLSLGRDWVWVETRSRYVWTGGCVVYAGGPRVGGLSYAFATVEVGRSVGVNLGWPWGRCVGKQRLRRFLP